MYTIIVFLFFAAFLLLYNSSKKVRWDHKPLWAITLAAQPVYSRLIGVSLMLIAAVLLVVFNGIGSGLFAALVILMGVGFLTVLLFPLRYFKAVHLLLIFCLLFGLEILIF
jgi:hypothetical protein